MIRGGRKERQRGAVRNRAAGEEEDDDDGEGEEVHVSPAPEGNTSPVEDDLRSSPVLQGPSPEDAVETTIEPVQQTMRQRSRELHQWLREQQEAQEQWDRDWQQRLM